MARVFLSYANEDRALAGELHEWLNLEGHEVFLAEDLRDGIAVGEDWQQRLHERLRWADAVVCVVTSAYVASRWCTAEAAISWWRGSRLLPLRAEPGVADPLLSSLQHIEYTHDPGAARVALHEALRRVDAAGGWGWPEGRSPFPGLRPFDIEQHRVFFGRTEETGELAELLRSPAERPKGAALLVVGPSGCGKSSLVRAGLLPVMAEEPGWWTLAPIVPSADPVAALVRELANGARQLHLGWTVAGIRDQLDEVGLTGLADELLLAAPGGSRRLLVVVDQFEELLTQAAPTDRARFAEQLRLALTGPVQLVATLRSEFLDQVFVDPELAALPMRTYALRPLSREALRTVVEGPARRAGIDVDDDLVAQLIEDTGSGEALPLLAFTLAQLAKGIGRGGRLDSDRYDELGGVRGALTHQADEALAEAVTVGGRSREQVITGLLRLVTVDEEGRRTRRRMLLQHLPHPVAAEMDAFVARRLLSTDTENGSAVIAVTHEAFLTAWSPLAQAITSAAAALRARRAVEHAAAAWDENARSSARLWTGGQLAAAVADTGARVQTRNRSAAATPRVPWLPRLHRVLITQHVDDLREEARDFLRASIRRDRFRRARGIVILSVLLTIALVGAGIAVSQQRAAEEQQRIATARQLVAQADAARETDPRIALLLGIAAQRIHPDGETQASLVNTLSTTRYAGTLPGHNGAVSSVAFSNNKRILAAGARDTVTLWDLTDPTRPRRLGQPLMTSQGGELTSVTFSPYEPILATSSADNPQHDHDTVLTLWDLTNPAQPRRLGQTLTGAGLVDSVTFFPDRHTLATSSGFDGTLVLWDVSDPTRPRRFGQPFTDQYVGAVALSPSGTTLATGGVADGGILWNLTNPTQPRRLGPLLTGHTQGINSVAFFPSGARLATGSFDGTVILWDVSGPAQPRRLGQPLTDYRTGGSLAFSPNGTTLATDGSGDTVTLWDLTDPTRPRRLGQPLPGTGGGVLSVAFSPDGRTLAGGDNDTVILWDVSDPVRPRRLVRLLTGYFTQVSLVVFSPDGRTLATRDFNGSTILWDVSEPAQPRRLGQPLPSRDGEDCVAFSPSGTTLATGDKDDTVTLWDLSNTAQPRRLGQPLPSRDGEGCAAFSPDGTTLAVGNNDGTVTLWDLTALNNLRDNATERACSITGSGLDRDEWARYLPGLPYQDTCRRSPS